MKVREGKGGIISIFYIFLTHKKCNFHQFSKTDKKTTANKNGWPIIYFPDKMYDTPELYYVLTAKIYWDMQNKAACC